MGKQVIKYQANDGELFNTEDEMVTHEKRCNFYELANCKPFNYLSLNGVDIEARAMVRWIEHNQSLVKVLL